MLARICEIVGLTGWATAYVLGDVTAGEPPIDIMKWGGLLALVIFMIGNQYRQGDRMGKAIDRKDAEILNANARAAGLAAEFTDAINLNSEAVKSLADALADRPCLANDSRVREPKVQT